MSRHEYYEELGALAAIDQITAQHYNDLDAHWFQWSTIHRSVLGSLTPPLATRMDARVVGLGKENENLRQELSALNHFIELKAAELAKMQRQNSVSIETLQGLQKQLEAARQEAER